MDNALLAEVAPELEVSEWLNAAVPLAKLRGRVVLIEAFQMLCPACVSSGLPQAQRVQRLFPDVQVIGLHTVFEHHAVMQKAALEVFLSEYRIDFPVAIDRPADGPIPVTMDRYALRGTPSTVLLDKTGRLRFSHLGAIDDLMLGSLLGQLINETPEGEIRPHSEAIGKDEQLHVCYPGDVCV